MARTTDQILAQYERLMPGGWGQSLRPLLAGVAAALVEAEERGDTLAAAGLFSTTGTWLRLHAHGYGIQPADGESDASLRGRLRQVENAVTRPALKAAVDALIDPLEAEIVEWWETSYVDVNLYLDLAGSRLGGGPRTFIVLVPAATSDAALRVIANEINRLRSAGIRWALARST